MVRSSAAIRTRCYAYPVTVCSIAPKIEWPAALFISIRVKRLLVGRSAEPELERRLEQMIAEDDCIEELFNALTIHFGPQVMLAAKIRMKPGLSIDKAVDCINRLERQIKERYPEIGWCFIEPDVTD